MCLQNSLREQTLDHFDTYENTSNHNYADSCDYIEVEDCKNIPIGINDLCIIELNIRGLVSEQQDLYLLLKSITQLECVDVVILVETWVTGDSKSRISILGYTYYGLTNPNKKGGGVGFLVHNDLSFAQRPDLLINSNVAENCFLALKGHKRNIIIGSVYRPPNKEFIFVFGDLMKKINKESLKDVIIGLDHNMAFLKHHAHAWTQQFLETATDFGLLNTVTRVTRITPSSATLIDNILLSQNLSCSKISGIIVSDLSDHMPCMMIIRQC